MPFTFSHPALVLPLSYLPKRLYSLTGLIIGSMTPDFEYFIRMRDLSIYSHTFWGLFYFDLPLGLILSFIFHLAVRNPLIENLPTVLKKRFIFFTSFDWVGSFKENWLIIIMSIFLGACSHIFWDSFTHTTGFFVRHFPSLKTMVKLIHYKIRIYNLIQHLSTIIGLIFVIYAIFKMPSAKISDERIDGRYWGWVIALSFIIIALRCVSGLDYRHKGDVVITIIAGGLWALVLTPLFYKRKFPR